MARHGPRVPGAQRRRVEFKSREILIKHCTSETIILKVLYVTQKSQRAL